MVSVARIRLVSRKSTRLFKGIICDAISEFESYHLSHAVSLCRLKATLKVKCPHCGGVHEISVRETYINGALQEVRRVHLGVDEQQHPHGH
jgi:hypothetical protein